MTQRSSLPRATTRPGSDATHHTASGTDHTEATPTAPDEPQDDGLSSAPGRSRRIRPAVVAAKAGSSAPSRWTGWDGDPAERQDGVDDDPDAVEAEQDVVNEDDAPRLVPGHFVMDHAAIAAALAASGFDGSYDHLSAGEEQRARTLVQYRQGSLFRRHLIGSPAMIARLDDLDRAAPNFAVVTRHIRRAAQISMVAGAPLRAQPTVLLGSPGIGKSRYCKLLAAALGTPCHIISGSTLPDVGSLTGYPPVWRGSGPGRLAKYLMSSATSGPLILCDEAEKLTDEGMTYPLDRLLPILEYDTARAYQDECLQVPMAAQHAVMLFACNSLETLSEPFLNRVLTLRIEDLAPAQRDAVLETMLADVAHALGLPITLASLDALAPIRTLGMRRCRLAFEIAIGHAVEQRRRFLTRADLAAAVTMLGHPDRGAAIGFFPQHAPDRD